LALQTTNRGTVEIILNDGFTESRWDSDPGMLEVGKLHHLVVVVDGGPKIITFIVDGVLCDGGDFRTFGWGRYNPLLRYVHSKVENWITAPGTALRDGDSVKPNPKQAEQREIVQIAPSLRGEIQLLRIYNRYLGTSEAIGNRKAGL
jgi:hypothetical protein